MGGGVAHGPKGQLAYKKRKLNKTEKKLSVVSLISEKNKLNNLLIFSDFTNEIKKTKDMNVIIKKFELFNSLIILPVPFSSFATGATKSAKRPKK